MGKQIILYPYMRNIIAAIKKNSVEGLWLNYGYIFITIKKINFNLEFALKSFLIFLSIDCETFILVAINYVTNNVIWR